MPPLWLQIKQARPDLTDYLIHWTRERTIDGKTMTAFEVLKLIIKCGFLKPSFARRPRYTVGGVENTIKGRYPAVCFTEQPLDAFIKSCNTLPSRYQPYGIAVRKDRLFEYGGRPVIYGDESQLNELPEDRKYLWVHFQPVPNRSLGGYPLDWTHEREWRARAKAYNCGELGPTPAESVPLLYIDYERSERLLPWILVKQKAEVEDLKRWLAGLPPYSGSNGVLREYFEVLPNVLIVPLNEVESRLKQGDARWSRLDTLPIGELYPKASATFQRIGWNRQSRK
jgi:hypothetical protein